MTDLPTTLEAVRGLTAPSREVADDVLLCLGWTRQPAQRQGYWYWTNPTGYTNYNGRRPNVLASMDDAISQLPSGSEWGRDDDGVMWVKVGGFLTAEYFRAEEVPSNQPAIGLMTAALAAEIERTK